MSEWEETKLGEILIPIARRVTVADLAEVPWAGARWYAEGIYARSVETADKVKTKTLNRLALDDITYNRMWATKAAFGVVGPDAAGCLVSGDFPVFAADRARLLPSYVRAVFKTESFQRDASARAVGTTERRRLKESDFLEIAVTLPSLAEQQRIVDVMAAVDSQIVALAVEAETLHCVVRLRRAELVNDETVPEVRAEQAFEFSTGVRRTPDRASGPSMTPYLRSANVGYGSLDLSDVQAMNYEAHEREKFGLRYGDVLVSEGSASAKAVGMPAMWRDELPSPVCFQMTLLRLRAIENVCVPSFAFHWCMWAYESGRFLDVAGGTSIKHISAKRSSQMPVRVPPITRQDEIAQELDSMSAQFDATRAELARLRSFRSAMLTALLSQDIEIPESYDDFLEVASA